MLFQFEALKRPKYLRKMDFYALHQVPIFMSDKRRIFTMKRFLVLVRKGETDQDEG